ncbi:uncharacterized protein PG998_008450 [Apiospora kogelbergensis]|uniref:uncharacterized protein n=1 Tax=Apiospora kogelbergensis TaxID=1337665 RepID=UPI0031308C54
MTLFLYLVQNIDGHVTEIVSAKDQETTMKILEWVTDINFGEKYSDCLKKRLEGTGEWLLNSSEYQKWLATPSQILLCSGMPGAGKTIISSTVIEHLESQSLNTDTALAYLYCDYNKKNHQTIEQLMLNLLKQLAWHKHPLPVAVTALHNQHALKHTRPQLKQIMEALRMVADEFSRVFVVVDALDEYSTQHESRRDFVNRLLTLQDKAHLSLFVTSRPITEITDGFLGHGHITMNSNGMDIRHYLSDRAPGVISFTAEKETLLDEIIKTISKASKGMFLLAAFHLDSLKDKVRKRDIEAALTKMSYPSQSTKEIYESVYNDTMERICCQLPGHKKWAMQVLGWLTYNMRPLKVVELQHALEMEPGRTTLELDENMFQADYLSSICAGLVTVETISGTIQLVHYTTQEYLRSFTHRWFPKIHSIIVTSCVTYISLQELSTSLMDESNDELQQKYPFYDYAIRSWLDHALHISWEEDNTTAQVILSYLQKVPNGVVMYWYRVKDMWYYQRRSTGLHIAAGLGCQTIILGMLNHHSIDERDSHGQAPLSYAIDMGQLGAAQFLVELGAEFEGDNWAVSHALRRNNITMTKLLIEHSSLGKAAFTSMSSLLINAQERQTLESLVHELGVEVNHPIRYGPKAINIFIEKWRSIDMVRLLLDNGADVNSQDTLRRVTPLCRVCEIHAYDVEMAKFLIERKANVNSADYERRTPLIFAVSNGKYDVARLLLEAGADASAATRDGETPLLVASREAVTNGTNNAPILELIEVLFDRGADPNTSNKKGETPILAALGVLFRQWRYDARDSEPVLRVIKLLLENGVSVNAARRDGTTALSVAREHGMHKMVALLASYDREGDRHSESEDNLSEAC